MVDCCRFTCGPYLFVRSFHTLLVLGIAGTLLYKEGTLLHHCLVEAANIPLGLAYMCVLGWALAMYFLTCLIDPGTVRPPSHKKKKIKPTVKRNDDDFSVEDDDDDDEESALPDSYCGNEEGQEVNDQMLPSRTISSPSAYRACDYCEINQPMRTKHCEDCNRCVRKFDHHCPWLEACIGENNHRHFWLFLFSTLTLILITLYIAWEAFAYRVEWSHWFKANWVLLADMVVLVVGGLVTAGLLSFHTYLMVKGVTTWEAASRERIPYLKYLDQDLNPFDEGLCQNTSHFLCLRHHRKWEKVYARKARETNNGIV